MTLDAYPYTAASTALTATLPERYHDGGKDALITRLRHPDTIADLTTAIAHGERGWENIVGGVGWEAILIASTYDHRFEGETLAAIAARLEVSPAQALVHVLLEEDLVVTMIEFSMDETDVERVLLDQWCSIGTDGLAPGFGGNPHPRMYGAFPRVLGRYVRDRRLFPLEEAVRKMTSLPAATFRIPHRGIIREGWVADIVVFEPTTVGDRLDYAQPQQTPSGLRWVIQKGRIVCADGHHIGGRVGERLEQLQCA